VGGEALLPSDLPAGLSYKLVFPNGCKSAQTDVPAPQAFADALGAEAYVGWSDEIERVYAAAFAQHFFSRLSGGATVSAAAAAAIQDMPEGNPREVVKLYLRILRGGDVVVDQNE
jgi:hypothetical protein